MFIACCPVYAKNNRLGSEVLILDTKDLSLEFISAKDMFFLINNGVEIEGISSAAINYLNIAAVDHVFSTEQTLSGNYYHKDGLITRMDGENFSVLYKIAGYELRITPVFNDMITINNSVRIKEFDCKDYALHYAFLYKDLLVSHILCDVCSVYYTAVLNKASEVILVYNNSGKIVCGDSYLMNKITMTFRY